MSEENQNYMPSWMFTTVYRETGRQVKVGPLDGRLMLFLVFLVVFPSMKALYVCIFALVFFWILDYKGYTLPNARRRISVAIAGKKRYATHYWRQKKFRY